MDYKYVVIGKGARYVKKDFNTRFHAPEFTENLEDAHIYPLASLAFDKIEHLKKLGIESRIYRLEN